MSAIVLDIRSGRRFDPQPMQNVSQAPALRQVLQTLTWLHDEHPGAFNVFSEMVLDTSHRLKEPA